MGRVPARLNVINAALVDIWLCGYASIRPTQGGGTYLRIVSGLLCSRKTAATPGPLRAPGVVDTQRSRVGDPLGSSGNRYSSAIFHAWISEQEGYRSPSYPRACQSRPRTTVRTTRLQRHKKRSRISCYFLPGRPTK